MSELKFSRSAADKPFPRETVEQAKKFGVYRKEIYEPKRPKLAPRRPEISPDIQPKAVLLPSPPVRYWYTTGAIPLPAAVWPTETITYRGRVVRSLPEEIDAIIDAVCGAFVVHRDAMLARSRQQWIVRPRWAAMLLMTELGMSTPHIARALGLKDHTSVMHGQRQGRKLIATDSDYAERVKKARKAAS